MNLKGLKIFVAVLLFLVILNLFNIRVFDLPLFFIAGRPITLMTVLVLTCIAWAYNKLPSPIREILLIILLLWVISHFGGFLFAGLSNLLLIIIILFIFLFIFGI